MAEGGVMDGTVAIKSRIKSSLSDVLWIVLTPSVDHAGWLRALARAASDCGRDLVEISSPVEPRERNSPPVLYVTHDASWISDADPDDILIIIPQPETSAEMTGELYGLHLPQSMFQASMLLAKAAELAERSRVLTARQLSSNPGRLELFPGIVVDPPVEELGRARPAIAVALSMYRSGAPRVGTTVSWSERLFTYDAKSWIEDTPLGNLDITGRARTLLYGPYIVLPPGRWQTKMRFAVDSAAAQVMLRFDWGLAASFVERLITPNNAGIYEIELDHTVSELDHWQFRIILMQGAFDGRLIFQGGTVTRLAAVEETAS